MTTLESSTERLADALRRLAVEAADLFEELLASGAELPFEIEPTDDGPLPMYQYLPLTGEFIERHMAELRRLEAFGEVRELAGEETATGFLIGLWEGRTEFDVAGDRLQGAIDGALAGATTEGADSTPAGEVIVPLIGFHMPADEIELDGVRIVRADSVEDAPIDAVQPKGFLARISCGAATVAPAAAIADDMRRTLRTMRLFRPGAVGLGAYGWARRAGGWERFGTGAARPRQGGYRLTGAEAAELERFSGQLTRRGGRLPALAWALSRFDLGSERASLIDALSDYLLALRGLLEGGGPAKLGLSARVSALADDRERARLCVERALAIERKLMSGSRFRPSAGASPLDVIAELEELLRRLLKGLATGEFQGDLRAQADEILLTEGLSAGETANPPLGETAEWRIPDAIGEEEIDADQLGDGGSGEIEIHRTSDEEAPERELSGERVRAGEDDQPTTRIVVTDVELPDLMAADRQQGAAPETNGEADWFSASDGELEWPAFASPRRDRERRRTESSDRVRYLFPVPDSTDWDVGELRYERQRPPGRSISERRA